MAEIAQGMVRDVLNAYGSRDAMLAVEVIRRDDKVDNFYNSIFRNLVSHMMENPATISDAAQLLFVARNLERIGDHATNVAEMVYFAATGEYCAERDERDADEKDLEGLLLMSPGILVVEDDRALCDLLTWNLSAEGYDVRSTGDGEEALLMVEEEQPDAIVLDWMIEQVPGNRGLPAACARGARHRANPDRDAYCAR